MLQPKILKKINVAQREINVNTHFWKKLDIKVIVTKQMS